MEKKPQLYIYFAVSAFVLLAGLFVTGYATNRNEINHLRKAISDTQERFDEVTEYVRNEMTQDSVRQGYAGAVRVYAPKVPEYMVFAGDTIRFDKADLYERMDRELIAFTYSHQISLLMLKRSTKYFPIIEPLLKANGVPDDLKYLMVIESNLDPEARSITGAAGFWQFIKTTAKEYGLEVSDTIDERYDVEKETAAACRYLKEAYAKYGDWMTVAASYNCGQGGVSGRLSRQKQRRAFDLWLPAETSRYMFRILTAKMMFEDPSAFGFTLEPEDYYKFIPAARKVTVSGDIDNLADFAADNGVSYYQLHKANPWLRDIKFKPSNPTKKYTIIIPQE